MTDDYLLGTDLLGADLASADRYLAIRFRDPGAVVAKEGGATGALAFKFAPATVTGKVYTETAKQIADQMKARGIDADIRVVLGTPPVVPTNGPGFGAGLAFGAGGAAALWAFWRFVLRGLFTRR